MGGGKLERTLQPGFSYQEYVVCHYEGEKIEDIHPITIFLNVNVAWPTAVLILI